jgi:hypothetical protein
MGRDNIIDIRDRIPLTVRPLDNKKELRVVSAWVEGDSVFIEVKRDGRTFRKKEKFSLQLSEKSLYSKILILDDKEPTCE